MANTKSTVWVIAGPTASGKSAIALSLAQKHNGVVINADSMQVYREIPIVTAQPSMEEQKSAPHMLYGTISILNRMSAMQWASAAVKAIRDVQAQGRQPILVGGSGLYLKTLMDGLSPIPDVPQPVRQQVCDLYDVLGPKNFHEALQGIDPVTAKRLHPTDRQRCIRAREVFEASGKTLSHWQSQQKERVGEDLTYRLLVLLPERDWLHERINKRFDQMVQAGALDEARAIQMLNPSPDLTGVQALGLQALRDYIEGRVTLFEAIEHGQTQSRQYAKRQYTWFRGQELPAAARLDLIDPNDTKSAEEFFAAN
jgi:tRNA dimethylallyltransferase